MHDEANETDPFYCPGGSTVLGEGLRSLVASDNCMREKPICSIEVLYVLHIALLQWMSQYAVGAYTTADSAGSIVLKPRSDRIDYIPSFAL